MKNIYSIRAGDQISGEYVGIPFSGTVESGRCHTAIHDAVILNVKLDQPIIVFGTVRESVTVIASPNRVMDGSKINQ